MKQIKNYTDYYIDEYGVVYSTLKGDLTTRKSSINSGGYAYLPLCKGGKFVHKYIHRLVYETFIGEIPEGMVINHIDGDKLNNKLDNLECVTQRKNCQCQNKKRNNKNGFSNIHKVEYYRVTFLINGKQKHFGRCKTAEEAVKLRDLIANKLTLI